MKKIFLICCALYWVVGQSWAQKEPHELLTVAFYNLENLFDPTNDPHKADDDFTPEGSYQYTEQVYKEKLRNMAKVLSQLGTEVVPKGPALIGVSEIENERVLKDLLNELSLKKKNYQYVHFESPDMRGIDVALLYRRDQFTVLQTRAIPVDLSNIQRRGKTRDILYVQGVLARDTIHVMVCHWPSRRGGVKQSAPLRTYAASVCRKIADSLFAIRPQAKIIIMGDLNDDPVNASITHELRATGEMKRIPEMDFYNPWVRFYQKGIGTLAHNDKWHLFDQIIISTSWMKSQYAGEWYFVKAEVFNAEFLKQTQGKYKGYPHRSFQNHRWNKGYSDHFPVLIYLGKPQKRSR